MINNNEKSENTSRIDENENNDVYSFPLIDFVFYHIEKCGGSSFRTMLYNFFVQNKIYNHNEIYVPKFVNNINFRLENLYKIQNSLGLQQFSKLKAIVGHVLYHQIDFLEENVKYRFSIIRHPVSRLISHYYFFDFPKTRIHMIDLSSNKFERLCKQYSLFYCSRFHCVSENNNQNDNEHNNEHNNENDNEHNNENDNQNRTTLKLFDENKLKLELSNFLFIAVLKLRAKLISAPLKIMSLDVLDCTITRRTRTFGSTLLLKPSEISNIQLTCHHVFPHYMKLK